MARINSRYGETMITHTIPCGSDHISLRVEKAISEFIKKDQMVSESFVKKNLSRFRSAAKKHNIKLSFLIKLFLGHKEVSKLLNK